MSMYSLTSGAELLHITGSSEAVAVAGSAGSIVKSGVGLGRLAARAGTAAAKLPTTQPCRASDALES